MQTAIVVIYPLRVRLTSTFAENTSIIRRSNVSYARDRWLFGVAEMFGFAWTTEERRWQIFDVNVATLYGAFGGS